MPKHVVSYFPWKQIPKGDKMPRKSAQKNTLVPTTPPAPQPKRSKAQRHENYETRMAMRRESKFEKFGVKIIEEEVTEHRNLHGAEMDIKFKFAVMGRTGLVGRAVDNRSALKLAHQYCRTMAKRQGK